MALYCAAFSPTGTSLRGAWAMASALGEAHLLDVTTSPAPEQGGKGGLARTGTNALIVGAFALAAAGVGTALLRRSRRAQA